MVGLRDKDLYLTNIYNQTGFKNIVNRYLEEKDTDVFESFGYFKRRVKNLVDIDKNINLIQENYESKRKIENEDKKQLLVF